MNRKRYRVGIVGLGRIGFTLRYDRKREQPASHSRAFSENPATFVAGGFDTDLYARRTFAKAYPGTNVYDSLPAMLSDGKWDVLVSAVDERSHLEVARALIAAKPRLVVLEKPVAPGLREAEKILACALKYRIPVAVNHERRFSRDYLLVKSDVGTKRYGRLVSMTTYLLTPHKAVYRFDSKTGRGSLIHDGTHLFDIAQFLTGERLRLDDVRSGGIDKHGEIEGVTVTGHLGAARFQSLVGFRTESFTFELDLQFERGRIRIGNGLLEFWESRESPYYEGFHSLVRDRRVRFFGKTGYFSGMVGNCVSFLDGNCELVSPLEDGVRSVRLVDKIVKSLRIPL